VNAGSPPPPDLGKAPAERAAGAVLPAAGLLYGAGLAMHAFGCPPVLDVGGASALLSAASWGAAGQGWIPGRLPAWLAVSGAWLTAADAAGPLHWWPAPVLSIAWAGIAAAASRAAHRHEAVVEAREWREARADWLGRSHAWGLAGSHLLAFERTRLGELYTVSTKGTGRRASHFVGRSLEEVIAEAEDLAVSRVRVTAHHLAGRIRVSVRRADPWADPLLHPLVCEEPEVELPAARSIRAPVPVGQDPETGEVLEVPLWDVVGAKNVSVTGIAGAGKGVLLDNLSEGVTAAPDALQVRINLSDKGYAEIGSWGPCCHLTAFGPDQKARAVAVLKVVADVIAWRARTYKRGEYQPSPADPLIVVINDESDESAAVPAVKKGLDLVATKGREYGVAYAHAGQRGTNDYGSAKQRSQDTVRCTGAVNRQGEVRHAAGNQAHSVPDMASYGEGQPGVWSVARNGAGQRTGRTWVFAGTPAAHGAEVERIAGERAFAQPELPAACAEYLGDAYAALLSDEVFTRWAHARDAGPQPDGPGDGAAAPEAAPSPAEVQDPAPGTAPAAPAPGTKTAVADKDPLEEMWKMNLDEGTRAKLDALHEKLGAAREALAATAALPRPPQAGREALAAHTAERWRQVGEEARIPEESRPRLLEMLAAGTTIGAVAEEFRLTKPVARGWLEKFRSAGAAYVDGQRKGARWRLSAPPGDEAAPPEAGDAP
jgi:hypothetical protein